MHDTESGALTIINCLVYLVFQPLIVNFTSFFVDVLRTGKRNASSLEFDESRDALGQSESKYQYRPLQILQIETETEVKAKMTKKNKKMHSKAKNEMQKP